MGGGGGIETRKRRIKPISLASQPSNNQSGTYGDYHTANDYLINGGEFLVQSYEEVSGTPSILILREYLVHK